MTAFSQTNDFEQWAGVQNVRVAFNVGEHEEHVVARVQRTALHRSESEIASLEQARAGSIDSEASWPRVDGEQAHRLSCRRTPCSRLLELMNGSLSFLFALLMARRALAVGGPFRKVKVRTSAVLPRQQRRLLEERHVSS